MGTDSKKMQAAVLRLVPAIGAAMGTLALVAGMASPAHAATSPHPLPTGFLGITATSNPPNLDFDRIRQSGAGTVRYALAWRTVQPDRGGPLRWKGADRFVRRASQRGLSVDFLVGTTPTWAATRGETGIWGSPIATAVGRKGWTRFIRAAVHRYGRKGSFWAANPALRPLPVVWTIWNEPNLVQYWGGRPSASAFAALMNFTGPLIHGVDSTARVIVGGVFCEFNWQTYLERFYQAVDKSSFDDVAVHPYNDSPYGSFGLILQTRHIMDRMGDADAGIWVDEISWGTDTTKKRFVTTPKEQAERIRILFQILAYQRQRLGLQRVLWFGFRDDPHTRACQFCGSSGFWSNATTPKPSWFVFKGYGNGPVGEIRGDVSGKTGKPKVGRELYLDLNADGQFEDGEPLRTTGEDGTFSFASLYPTEYPLRLLPQRRELCAEPTDCTRIVQVLGGGIADGQHFVTARSRPNTRITKAKIKSKKRKAKFKFKATAGKAPLSFKCKLDRKHWKDCKSPKKYKHLKRGKHKFKVRAKGADGKVDRTPAKKKFKIKHHHHHRHH